MGRSSRRKLLVDTTIPEGEHDELVHIPAWRVTWCLKVWPLECRTDGRYLRTHTNQHLVTCPDCQARLVASILERQP